MPDILANRLWQQYNWTREGEEWSEWWGSSFTQWVTTVYPRIGSYFPTKSILEIAPGYGRWTRFLVHGSELYRGVDLSQNCVEFCEQRMLSSLRMMAETYQQSATISTTLFFLLIPWCMSIWTSWSHTLDR